MTTKEDAERAADALIDIERRKREEAAERQTRTLVWTYPLLRRIPATERKAALADATADAERQVTVRIPLALLVLSFMAFIGADLSGQVGVARGFGWAAAALFLVWQAQRHFSIRAGLRAQQDASRECQ